MKRLKSSLQSGENFVITAELTGGPGFSYKPIEHFLEGYRNTGLDWVPSGFELTGLTLPQNPGGQANIDPGDVYRFARERDLLADLDFIPHLSCKDQNADALMSVLLGYRRAGVESILALTGDKPLSAKGVFELGAIGLLQLVRQLNNDAYRKVKPDQIEYVHQFYPGAAVSPFKYTEASQMQQYFKMENKITAGAEFLITQVGWDWKKSLELKRYLEENSIDIPVLGNVYFLTSTNPAPRLMHDIKLPGCFVSDALLARLNEETLEQHMERCARQLAMYKSMGYAGADLGGVHDFEQFKWIVNRAAEIGDDWEDGKESLCWPAKNAWYLYDDSGNRVSLSKKKKTIRHHFFKGMHRAVLDPDYKGFAMNRAFMRMLRAHKKEGFGYKCVFCGEKISKYLIFDCEECGDCFLPENFGLCTIGGCEKGLDNAPCGDSTVEGYCGNNLERICIGESIYDAASSEKNGLETLRATLNSPRNPSLENTSSVVNYVFGFDHTGRSPLIKIGPSLNAADTVQAQIMGRVLEHPQIGQQPGSVRDYLRAMIEAQASGGADYILVDVDPLSGDTDVLVRAMTEFVRIVRRWSQTASVCISSKHEALLRAGLKEWYNTAKGVSMPLLRGVTAENVQSLLKLKKQYNFGIVAQPAQMGENFEIEACLQNSRHIFEAAKQVKFAPEDIFFEIPCFAMAKDMDLEAGTRGVTNRTMECISHIKKDAGLKKARVLIELENASIGLPRRIGVNRGYAAAAMKRGLDAGIMDAAPGYGDKPADEKIVEMVELFARLDGNAQALEEAKERLNAFCSKKKKTA